MIEVNLHPGAKKRPNRRSAKPSFSLPSFGGGGGASSLDRAMIGVVAAWILGPGLILWMFLGTGSRREELNLSIEQAVQDSARYAAVIAAQEDLRARRDTIARKLEIIQEIDAGRYIWAHILDEVSRALPEYTWLTRITPVESEGSLPNFQIVGRTGNTFALTRFMTDLEASPFIREVRLTTTEQVREQGDRVVHEFILLASYEEPPADAIETVPLFVGED